MNSNINDAMFGAPQKLEYFDEIETVLVDPYACTLTNFIQYCLKELTEVLHYTVIHTHQNLIDKHHQSRFFLTGFGERRGWNSLQRKFYGNPLLSKEGKDLKWLLKNFRWNYKKYSMFLNIYEDTFDDITGFLLYDILQSHNLSSNLDMSIVLDCFDATIEVVSAISESKYYNAISSRILKYKANLETLLPLVTEFQTMISQQKKSHQLDTKLVLDFLQNKNLIEKLKKEEKSLSKNPLEKPLTNYFLNVVMTRLNKDEFAGDSGFVDDDITVLDDKLSNETNDQILLNKSNQTSFLHDQSPNGSMVIINHAESTPIKQRKKSPQKRYSKLTTEAMDGSFVLL